MKFSFPTEESGLWNLDFGLWNLDFANWNLDSGCSGGNLEFGFCNLEFAGCGNWMAGLAGGIWNLEAVGIGWLGYSCGK